MRCRSARYRDRDCVVRRQTGVYAGVSCLPAEVVQGNGGRSAALRMTLLHELDSHDNTAPVRLEHMLEPFSFSPRQKDPFYIGVQSSVSDFAIL